MNANAKAQHAEWLRTFRDLEAYTNGFTEPMQGKTQEWFLAGPLFLKTWLKNAEWAKALTARKFHAKLVPGIEYAKAFVYYQSLAYSEMRLNHEPFREILKQYEPIIKNLQQ